MKHLFGSFAGLSLILVLAFGLTACSNDESLDYVPDQTPMLPISVTKIYLSDDAQFEYKEVNTFEYDATNRLTKIDTKTEEYAIENKSNLLKTLNESTTLTYGDKGEIQLRTMTIDEAQSHPTDLSTVSIKNYIPQTDGTIVLEDNEHTKLSVITLNNKGKVVTNQSTSANLLYQYIYDDHENVLQYREKKNNEDNKVWRFKFDGRNGIYKNIKTPQYVLIDILGFEYNVSNIKQIFGLTATKFEVIYNNELEYNTQNYPIKIKGIPTKTVSNTEYSITVEYTNAAQQ